MNLKKIRLAASWYVIMDPRGFQPVLWQNRGCVLAGR